MYKWLNIRNKNAETKYCQFLGYPKVIMEQIMDGLSSQEDMIFTKPLNNLYGHNGN